MTRVAKRPPTMQETQVQSPGREDPLEKEMATHSSTLAWRIPWMEECGRLQSMRSQRVRHAWATHFSLFFYPKGGERAAGCCRFLGVGILCSHSCAHSSGHNIPINLPQEKCTSLFYNFLSVCEWKHVMLLKVRASRMGSPVHFRRSILLWKMQSLHDKAQITERKG